MKRLLFSALGVLFLASCATIPSAEKSGDTLVIGSFVVDFPDGLFNEEPRTFMSGLALTFRNVTRGSTFAVATSDTGYFWFLSNGTDSYELASYHYDYVSGSGHRYTLDSEIGYAFTTVPRSVVYLGHQTLIYAHPQRQDPTAYDRGQAAEWGFDISWKRDFRTAELREHLSSMRGGSAWLARTIVSTQEVEETARVPRTVPTREAPSGIALDTSGNIYFADSSNNRVRKIDVNGRVSTVAGTGVEGHEGDGGPAVSARLSHPRGLALDSSGSLYIADVRNHCIRRVSPDGTIATVAGRGKPMESSAESLGDGGPATEASLNLPFGIALDGKGNLYIADSSNHRIRKVDTEGIMTTVAGSGTRGFFGDGGPALRAGLNLPMDVAVDDGGNLYIADQNNHRVRKVSGELITTVAGGGDGTGKRVPALKAKIGAPVALTVDRAGNLYVLDYDEHAIRRVDSEGMIDTIAEHSVHGVAKIVSPTDILVAPDGSLYIADPVGEAVLKMETTGQLSRLEWK